MLNNYRAIACRRLFIGAPFLDGGPAALVLGDDNFYGGGLPAICREAMGTETGATVFAYHVEDPERNSLAAFESRTGIARSIEEKPAQPQSNWAVTGLHFYDSQITDIAASIRPSANSNVRLTIYRDIGVDGL